MCFMQGLKPLFSIGVGRHGFHPPKKEGPTLKPNSSKFGICQGRNSFTLASWTLFQNWRVCVASMLVIMSEVLTANQDQPCMWCDSRVLVLTTYSSSRVQLQVIVVDFTWSLKWAKVWPWSDHQIVCKGITGHNTHVTSHLLPCTIWIHEVEIYVFCKCMWEAMIDLIRFWS